MAGIERRGEQAKQSFIGFFNKDRVPVFLGQKKCKQCLFLLLKWELRLCW